MYIYLEFVGRSMYHLVCDLFEIYVLFNKVLLENADAHYLSVTVIVITLV